ncbi:MAG: hypothetical protein M1820_000547 [Bogoriella megaspora]|nr:MAG: hypothetical protein M1820_000547 [Bogoriella megaspora]
MDAPQQTQPTPQEQLGQERLRDLIAALNSNPTTSPLLTPPHSAPPTDTNPPPYPFPTEPNDTDSDLDDSDVEPPTSTPATILNVDASTHIIGSHNMVSVNSPTGLAAVLYNGLRQIGNMGQVVLPDGRVARGGGGLKVVMNCGVSVRGDRNMVGGVMLKPRVQGPAMGGAAASAEALPSVVAGTKRAAEDSEGLAPEARRAKTEG